MPTDADAPVRAVRKWLNSRGGGGPPWAPVSYFESVRNVFQQNIRSRPSACCVRVPGSWSKKYRWGCVRHQCFSMYRVYHFSGPIHVGASDMPIKCRFSLPIHNPSNNDGYGKKHMSGYRLPCFCHINEPILVGRSRIVCGGSKGVFKYVVALWRCPRVEIFSNTVQMK